MQNLHFLSLLALPTPCILKSLTAFLVLNINRILAESSVRAGGLRPQRHGRGCSSASCWPYRSLAAQSIRRPKGSGRCRSVCSVSIPSPLGMEPKFPLGDSVDPTSESTGGARPGPGQSECWVPPAAVIGSGMCPSPQKASERLLWDSCWSWKDKGPPFA